MYKYKHLKAIAGITIILASNQAAVFGMERPPRVDVGLPISLGSPKIYEKMLAGELASYLSESCLFFADQRDDCCCALIMLKAEFDHDEVLEFVRREASINEAFKIALEAKKFVRITETAQKLIERIYNQLMQNLGFKKVDDSRVDGEKPVGGQCAEMLARYRDKKRQLQCNGKV